MNKNLSKEERQNKNYELRDRFWNKVGNLDKHVLSYNINPAFMNQPAWPDLRQAYRRILTEDSVIVATDGLSDEFSESESADNGFEIELYVELNDPEYMKMSLQELGNTWVFQLLHQAALNAAYSGNYKQLAEDHDVFSTEFYDVELSDKYLTSEETVGVLIGMESKKVPSKVELFASEVLMLSVTLLKLDELEYIVENGGEGRREIVERLKQAGINSISSMNRKSVVQEEFEGREEEPGTEEVSTIEWLCNLADEHMERGEFEEAEEQYQEALEIMGELWEEDSDTADILCKLAELYENTERYAEAEVHYQRALKIYEEEVGEEHPDTAVLYSQLAGVYENAERYEEAEKYYKKAIEIFEGLDPDDSFTAIPLSQLAKLYHIQEKYEEAEKAYKKAIELLEPAWETEEQKVILSGLFFDLSRLYEQLGSKEEADAYYEQALEIARKTALPQELEEYRSLFEDSTRPIIEIKAQKGKTKAWESKFGGNPYLPQGYEYPRDSEGNPMKLLAQINFEELPDIGLFPAQGMLQVYISVSRKSLYGLDFSHPTRQDDYRIVYIPEVKQDKALQNMDCVGEIPEDDQFPIPSECALSFVEARQCVASTDFQFKKIFGRDAYDLAYEAFEDEEAINEFYERFAPAGHRMGGYAYFTQQDPRTTRNSFKDYEVLLLQIDTDNENEIEWGDSGVANFFIKLEDLKKLDFSKVLYHWDCF